MSEPEEPLKDRLAGLLMLIRYATGEAMEMVMPELEELLESSDAVINARLHQAPKPLPKPRIRLVAVNGVCLDARSVAKP
jgi:hypothetical protein